MKITVLSIFFILPIFLSCNKNNHDQLSNSEVYSLIKRVDCINSIDIIEIFKVQEIPIEITNYTKEEFEEIISTVITKNMNENINLKIKYDINYTLDNSSCLKLMASTGQIDVNIFNSLKELLDDKLEFIPGKRISGLEVNAVGTTVVTIKNGQTEFIEHNNYIFN